MLNIHRAHVNPSRRSSGFRRLWARARLFLHDRSGAATVESGLAIAALICAFCPLAEIAHGAWSEDRMGRAARAAAHAVALMPQPAASAAALRTVACGAIGRELDIPGGCGAGWTVTVEAYASPAALLAGTPRPPGTAFGGEDGDMVSVSIAWHDAAQANAGDGTTPARVAVAVARNERAVE